MAAINFKPFRGEIPRLNDRLLKPNYATRALNCKISSGALEPLSGIGLVLSSSITLRTVFRYRVFRNDAYEENWLAWDKDVDVVPSLNANDELGRFYFTGEGMEPRMSTYTAAIASAPYPTAWYQLGVFAPTAAPSVSIVAAGSGSVEARSYVYTFVTQFGEESPPSPPSAVVESYPNSTWRVSGMQTAPTNTGFVTGVTDLNNGRVRVSLNTVFGLEQYDTVTFADVGGMSDLNESFRVLTTNTGGNYVEVPLDTTQSYTSGGTWVKNAPHNTTGMTKRVYRTVSTSGAFLFVAEIPAASTQYDDTVVETSLGEVLPTLNHTTPPKNLVSLGTLPNGCLFGLAENELCISEPYQPYSWPIANRYSFAGRGVAAMPAGNSIVVLTDTYPILYTGSDPAAMTGATLETYAPCVAKRGVTNIGGGVLYPSFDGLWLVSPSRVECLTRTLYREEEWAVLNPSTFDAAFHDGQYYAAYRGDTAEHIFVLNLSEADSVAEVDDWVDNLYRNELDGRLYVSKGDKLYVWDDNSGSPYDADWVSADIQLGQPTNFSVAQVHADFGAIVPVDTTQITSNEALITSGADAVAGHLCGHELLAFEVNGSYIVPVELDTAKRVQFTIYADKLPVYTKNVASNRAFRLPGGYKTELVNVGITASVKTYSVTIAETIDELKQASA
jgi:hypothetical protein